MKITFKNLADDIDVFLSFENLGEISIAQSSDYELDIDTNEIVFSPRFIRNFDVDKSNEEKDLISDWLDFSVGSAIVQIENKYRISNLIDGDVIELNDRWHYVPTTKKETFFGCLPSIYYFGAAECQNAEVEIVLSSAFNREAFIKLYKRFFIIMDLSSSLIGFVKYKVQLKRQKRISSDECLTKTFKSIYELPYDEREYQFQPIIVIFDRIAEALLSKVKLPKKLKAKLEQKIGLIKLSIFGD